MGKSKELIIEDFERLSELDKIYLKEKEQEMICEWQQWEEKQNRIPAEITIKKKQNDTRIYKKD